MGESAAWCVWVVAVLLVSGGVAADGYLAWMFIRDRRVGRAEERAGCVRWRTGVRYKRCAEAIVRQSLSSRRLRACAGIAAVGLAAGLAAAQAPAAQPEGSHATSNSTLPRPSGDTGPVAADEPIQTSTEPSAKTCSSTDPLGSAVGVQLNLDFTNAYFYRGIRQQDKGLIVQPAARLTTRLVDSGDFKLDGFIGTWNSFGPNSGSQTGSLVEDWYESDLYAGFTLTRGKLSLTTSYTFLTSPSVAFQTVQELGFTLALDDAEWMKEWALKPYATFAIETGSNGSDGPGLGKGVYLELGIAPGFSFDVDKTPITLTFPASVGLSLSDYYQDAGGDDDTFGFAQVGVKASIPLGQPGRFGTWTLNTGVSVLFLGDNTKSFNSGNGTEVIGTVGLQWNF